MKQTADNQAGFHQFLTSTGIAYDDSTIPKVLSQGIGADSFATQLKIQRQYFDGRSGERLLQVFRNLNLATTLKFRKAIPEDLNLLFEWANDPEVRRHSFNSAPILLQDHTRWFQAKLDNPAAILYLAESDGKPVAHIRFDITDRTATLSYLIGADYRGKGLGHTVLLKGLEQLLQDRPDVQLVEGLVQEENVASIKSFEKAGFRYGEADPAYPKAFRLTWQPEN